MKLIDTYTARGIIDRDNGVKRLSLFDGRFDTAYRIVSVKCAVSDLSSANEAYLVVSTEATGRDADNWDWGLTSKLVGHTSRRVLVRMKVLHFTVMSMMKTWLSRTSLFKSPLMQATSTTR